MATKPAKPEVTETENTPKPATKAGWKNKLILGVMALVAAVGIGILALRLPVGDARPEDALKETWKAMQEKSLMAFETHVDVSRLTQSFMDQLVETEALRKKSAESGLDQVKSVFTQGLMGLFGAELNDRFSGQLRNFVTTGQFGANPMEKGVLPELWAVTGKNPQAYQGYTVVYKDQQKAEIALIFAPKTLGGEQLELHLNLEKVTPSDSKPVWKIVGISNLPAFYQRLDALKAARLEALNAPIRKAIEESIHVTDSSKSSGVSEWGIGKGVMLRLAYENTSARPITALGATVQIIDADGTLLREVTLTDSDTLTPGATAEKAWPMTINPLSKNDGRIFDAGENDLTLKVSVTKVQFADGTTLKLYQNLDEAAH